MPTLPGVLFGIQDAGPDLEVVSVAVDNEVAVDFDVGEGFEVFVGVIDDRRVGVLKAEIGVFVGMNEFVGLPICDIWAIGVELELEYCKE